MSTLNNIKSLEKQRQLIIKKLLSLQPMIRGTFSKTPRRCGKAGCWCEGTPGHPCNRIVWTYKGRSYSKTISKENIGWVKKMTKHYRQFRCARQKLRELQEKIRLELNKLEEEVVKKTNNSVDFL